MDTIERILKERRIYPRVKEKIFIFCRFKGKNRILEAITKNISAGGIMFESEESILPNRTMEVELYLLITSGVKKIISMPVEAKTVWIRRIEERPQEEGSNRFKIGARFCSLPNREYLLAYIKDKIRC